MSRLDHALSWAKDRHVTRPPRQFRGHDRLYHAGPAKKKAKALGWDGQHHGIADVRRLLADQHGLCAYCGQPMTFYHVDHVVPLAKGGGNDAANLALACPACNMAKGDKSLLQWLFPANSS